MLIQSKENVSEDPTIPSRPGWEGMHTWWVVSRETSGTTGVVCGINDFAPGVAHSLHRHANARETLYIARGGGVMFSDVELRRVQAGDVVTIEPNEWHAFKNDRQETAQIICFYAQDSYADLDYEERRDSVVRYKALRAADPSI